MSIIDQGEIDALLSEAGGLATEANHEAEKVEVAAQQRAAPRPTLKVNDPSLRRLLRLKVPVIVQLARRGMSVHGVRNLSVGAIIEFEKAVEEPLDLLISDQMIGHGTCVKVGENFGLRVTEICDQRTRLNSMTEVG